MNRRSFFRTAALPTAAALYASERLIAEGQKNPSTLPVRGAEAAEHPAMPVNMAADGFAAGIANPRADFFMPLEELYPCDPGELSGAKLFICETGRYTFVSAGIGDTLQPFGYGNFRSSHWLGSLDTHDTGCLAATDLASGDGFAAILDGQTYPVPEPSFVTLKLSAGENPELRLRISGHCLGVLRGGLLARFLSCLRSRCALAAA